MALAIPRALTTIGRQVQRPRGPQTPANSPGTQVTLSLSQSFRENLDQLAEFVGMTTQQTLYLSEKGKPRQVSASALQERVAEGALDAIQDQEFRVTFISAYVAAGPSDVLHAKDLFRLRDNADPTPEITNEGDAIFDEDKKWWKFYKTTQAAPGIAQAGWYTLETGVLRSKARPDLGKTWTPVARVVVSVDISSESLAGRFNLMGGRTYVVLEANGETEVTVPHTLPLAPNETSTSYYEVRIIQDGVGPWDESETALFSRWLADHLFSFEVEPKATERMLDIDLELGSLHFQGARLIALLALGFTMPSTSTGDPISWPLEDEDAASDLVDWALSHQRNPLEAWNRQRREDMAPRLLEAFVINRIKKQFPSDVYATWYLDNAARVLDACRALRGALARVSSSGGDVVLDPNFSTSNSMFLAHRYIGGSTRLEITRLSAREFSRAYRFRFARVLNLRGTIVGIANRTSTRSPGIVERSGLPWLRYTDSKLVANPPVSSQGGEESIPALERELNRLMAKPESGSANSLVSTNPLHQAIYVNQDVDTDAVLAVRFVFTRFATPVVSCPLGSTIQLALPPAFGADVPVEVRWTAPDPAIFAPIGSAPTGREFRITTFSDAYYGLYNAIVKEKRGDSAVTVTFDVRKDNRLPIETSEALELFLRIPNTYNVFDAYLRDTLALPEKNFNHAQHAVALQQLVNLHGGASRFTLVPTSVDLRAILGFDPTWHPPYLRYHVDDAMIPPSSLVLWHPRIADWRMVTFNLDQKSVEQIAAGDPTGISILRSARNVTFPYLGAMPGSGTTIPIGFQASRDLPGEAYASSATIRAIEALGTQGGHVDAPLKPPILSALTDESYETWVTLQPELRRMRNLAGLADTSLLSLPVRLVHAWIGQLADPTDYGSSRQKVFASVHRQLEENLRSFWSFARDDNSLQRSKPSLPDAVLRGAVTPESVIRAWKNDLDELPDDIRRKVTNKALDDVPPAGTPAYLMQRYYLNLTSADKSQVSLYRTALSGDEFPSPAESNDYDLEKLEWTITYRQMLELAQELLSDTWISDEIPAYGRYPSSTTERRADAAREVFAFKVPDERTLNERPEARAVIRAVKDTWSTLEEPEDVQLWRLFSSLSGDMTAEVFGKLRSSIQAPMEGVEDLESARAKVDEMVGARATIARLLDIEDARAAEEAEETISEQDEDLSPSNPVTQFQPPPTLQNQPSSSTSGRGESETPQEEPPLQSSKSSNKGKRKRKREPKKTAEEKAKQRLLEEERARQQAEEAARKLEEAEKLAAEREEARRLAVLLQEEEDAAEKARMDELEATIQQMALELQKEQMAAETARLKAEAEAAIKDMRDEVEGVVETIQQVEQLAIDLNNKLIERIGDNALKLHQLDLDSLYAIQRPVADSASAIMEHAREASQQADLFSVAEDAGDLNSARASADAVSEAVAKANEELRKIKNNEQRFSDRLKEIEARNEKERLRKEAAKLKQLEDEAKAAQQAAEEAEAERVRQEQAILEAAREPAIALIDQIRAQVATWNDGRPKEELLASAEATADAVMQFANPQDIDDAKAQLLTRFMAPYHAQHGSDVLLPKGSAAALTERILADPSLLESELAKHEAQLLTSRNRASAQAGELSKHAEDLARRLENAARMTGQPAADDQLGQALVNWNNQHTANIIQIASQIASVIDPSAAQNAIEAGLPDAAQLLASSLEDINATASGLEDDVSKKYSPAISQRLNEYRNTDSTLGDRFTSLDAALRETATLVAGLERVHLNNTRTLVSAPGKGREVLGTNFMNALIPRTQDPEVYQSESDKQALLNELVGGTMYEFRKSTDVNGPFSASVVQSSRLRDLVDMAGTVKLYSGTIGPQAYGFDNASVIQGTLGNWLVDAGGFPFFQRGQDDKAPVLIAGFDEDDPNSLLLVRSFKFVRTKNNSNAPVFLGKSDVRASTLSSWLMTMANNQPAEAGSSEKTPVDDLAKLMETVSLETQINEAISFVGSSLSGITFDSGEDDSVYHT